MVVASLTFAVGTLLSFVMANAVVAARGFLLPYTCKKDDEDDDGENNNGGIKIKEHEQWPKENQFLIMTS